MRENRTHGSEGGVPGQPGIPTPIKNRRPEIVVRASSPHTPRREPRRGDIFIAWGVSPRNPRPPKYEAP